MLTLPAVTGAHEDRAASAAKITRFIGRECDCPMGHARGELRAQERHSPVPMTNNPHEGAITIQGLDMLDDIAVQAIADAVKKSVERSQQRVTEVDEHWVDAYIKDIMADHLPLDGCAFPDCDCGGVNDGEQDEAPVGLIITDGGYTAILADGTELSLDERAQVSYNGFNTPTVTLTLAVDAVTFL